MLAHYTFPRDFRLPLLFPEFTRWRLDTSGRGVQVTALRPLARWDCEFESHRDMDVCFLWLFCLVRLRNQRRANHSSRGVLPRLMCLSVIVKLRQREDPGLLRGGKVMREICWSVTGRRESEATNKHINAKVKNFTTQCAVNGTEFLLTIQDPSFEFLPADRVFLICLFVVLSNLKATDGNLLYRPP